MRTLALIAILALSACQSSKAYEEWRVQAIKDCQAKPNEFDRQNCLQQIEAVAKQREVPPDEGGKRPSGPGRP